MATHLGKKLRTIKKNYQIALNLINPLKEKLGPSRPALNFLFKVIFQIASLHVQLFSQNMVSR